MAIKIFIKVRSLSTYVNKKVITIKYLNNQINDAKEIINIS
jgi:hypothetical protein